jgi:hypothetical protein
LACVACASPGPLAPAFTPAVEPARHELWVDASALGPGDGSRAQPFRALASALERSTAGPTTVWLATGLYQGPFELPSGVRLVGAAAVVLHAEGAAVVHASGAATLERLMVQGAAIGLVASGAVEMKAVKFSGQSDTAVRVEAGSLTATDCEFAATISQTRGLVVGAAARATLVGCAFDGPFRRALEATSAAVRVEQGRFDGPTVGVHQVGGALHVERSSFSGSQGVGLFSSGGSLTLKRVSVTGHEYGLQTGAGTHLEAVDFTSVKAERAAIALVKTTGWMTDVAAVESGSFGALQLLESDLRIERLRIDSPLASGLLVRLGRLVLEDAVISRVRAETGPRGESSGGDAVVIRGADARLSHLAVAGAQGAGLVVTSEAHVTLSSATFDDCRWGGVAADRGARLEGVSLLVRRSPGAALTVSDHAVVKVDLLWAEGVAGGAVSADCASGARVLLSRTRGAAPLAPAQCVGQWTR